MKVQICTGARCTYYGANSIIDLLYGFKEDLSTYEDIPRDAELDIELIPCSNYCKHKDRVVPIVYIDGELIKNAKSHEIMERVFNGLKEDSDEK